MDRIPVNDIEFTTRILTELSKSLDMDNIRQLNYFTDYERQALKDAVIYMTKGPVRPKYGNNDRYSNCETDIRLIMQDIFNKQYFPCYLFNVKTKEALQVSVYVEDDTFLCESENGVSARFRKSEVKSVSTIESMDIATFSSGYILTLERM